MEKKKKEIKKRRLQEGGTERNQSTKENDI